MLRLIAATLAGAIFGVGLTIAQMTNPAKVLSFLTLLDGWDGSLALVMASAVAVTAIGYRLVWMRERPLLASRFVAPDTEEVDARLMLGAGLFGLGWGAVGLCPGPAIAALGFGGPELLGFVAAMFGGMAGYELLQRGSLLTSAS